MADNITVARPYAQALFEIASQASALDAWSSALEAAGAVVADDAMAARIDDPRLSADKLLELLQSVLSAVPQAATAKAPTCSGC